MNKKDLLIVLNIFGHHQQEQRQIDSYRETLKGVFAQIENAPDYSFRVVIAACRVSDKCIQDIKAEFGDKITIFSFEDRYTCQVTSNSTILKSINYFNEEYEGYLYISSGIFFPDLNQEIKDYTIVNENNVRSTIRMRIGNPKMLHSVVEKLKTGKYGIIQFQVDTDHGNHFLGFGPHDWSQKIDFQLDYKIPMGNHANFHIAAIHHSLKDFYEKPISDIHGFCGMEATLSYCCAALRKQYILMGDSMLIHHQKFDNDHSAPGRMLNTKGINVIGSEGRNPCQNLLWGREKEEISNDLEAQEAGLGYYPGPASCNEVDWNGVRLVHKKDKYDEDYLSLDPKLKDVVKRLFFTNKNDLNYNHIYCKIF
tara:strand:- start:7788 stop:8888 length:1101 start_codon:yes stop_codon:yes gene_type:complete